MCAIIISLIRGINMKKIYPALAIIVMLAYHDMVADEELANEPMTAKNVSIEKFDTTKQLAMLEKNISSENIEQ